MTPLYTDTMAEIIVAPAPVQVADTDTATEIGATMAEIKSEIDPVPVQAATEIGAGDTPGHETVSPSYFDESVAERVKARAARFKPAADNPEPSASEHPKYCVKCMIKAAIAHLDD